MDAAKSLTGQRVQEHHASFHIAGPCLHLEPEDNYRRLGSTLLPDINAA